MALHHTQIKKLHAADMAYDIVDGVLSITMDGVVLAKGPEANAKALVAEAINKAEDEDFDLEALREEQDEASDEDAAADEAADEAEGEGEGGSVVKGKYRERYKEIGANDSNGDALALALREHLTIVGEKARDTRVDEAAARALAEAHGVTYPEHGRNPGHRRMILGNILRGMWQRGHAITVGATVIEPTPEGKARMAAAMEKDKARNERQARPTQTAEERKAKAKARREARKAEKKSAHEPEAESVAA